MHATVIQKIQYNFLIVNNYNYFIDKKYIELNDECYKIFDSWTQVTIALRERERERPTEKTISSINKWIDIPVADT